MNLYTLHICCLQVIKQTKFKMVITACCQRLYGIISYADFLCEKVIHREVTETEGLVYIKSLDISMIAVYKLFTSNTN